MTWITQFHIPTDLANMSLNSKHINLTQLHLSLCATARERVANLLCDVKVGQKVLT